MADDKRSGVRLVLFGAPGAGKGVQGQWLATAWGVPTLSTGEAFRRALREKTALGLEAQGYMTRGELAPDDLVNRIVEDLLGGPECAGGFILDGYPRTVAQAEFLDGSLVRRRLTLDAVLALEVGPEVIVRRLASRRVCEGCGRVFNMVSDPPPPDGRCPACGKPVIQRADDREETIRERLAVYARQTEPLKAYYQHRDLLVPVDGDGAVDAIRVRIEASLTRKLGRWCD